MSKSRISWMDEGSQNVYTQYPIKCQCCRHIETSQLICCANQLTYFYMRRKLSFNVLLKPLFLDKPGLSFNKIVCSAKHYLIINTFRMYLEIKETQKKVCVRIFLLSLILKAFNERKKDMRTQTKFLCPRNELKAWKLWRHFQCYKHLTVCTNWKLLDD